MSKKSRRKARVFRRSRKVSKRAIALWQRIMARFAESCKEVLASMTPEQVAAETAGIDELFWLGEPTGGEACSN